MRSIISWRLVRYFAAVLAIYFIAKVAFFGRNQSRFQTFLHTQTIQWEDFPPSYAELLRTRDEPSIRAMNITETFPETQIPPIIHFIWFQNLYNVDPTVSEIPSLGSNVPDLCREYNPTYTVNVWNATSSRALLEEHYPWFLKTYDNYAFPIQRVDAIKYFVLYHYGGVYMDMDISCRWSLHPLLQYPAWFPEALPLGINNDLMAARARHPILMQMIQALEPRNRNLIFPYLTIYWSTGPQFTSDILKQYFLEQKSDFVKGTPRSREPNDFMMLPREFYSELYTFFGHRPGGSWHGSDVAVVLWFVAHPAVFWAIIVTAFGACGAFCLRRFRRGRDYVYTDVVDKESEIV